MDTNLALDLMGGDQGPPVTVPAIAQALSHLPKLHLHLVGNIDICYPLLAEYKLLNHPRITLTHASQSIGMGEKPLTALRSYPDSSLKKALELVQTGQVAGMVSAGNTGALMMLAVRMLPLLPHIERPALIKKMPSLTTRSSYLLDLGANVTCTPRHLLQFAQMGSVLIKLVEQRANPSVALLNVGSEENKGTVLIQEAAQLLKQDPHLNYVGFIEANQLLEGVCDLIVTDGFSGNIALKSAEGTAKWLLKQTGIQQKGLKGLLLRLLIGKGFAALKPDHYNGATLLGLNGIVVKSHGRADVPAFFQAIELAALEAAAQLPQKIAERLNTQCAKQKVR